MRSFRRCTKVWTLRSKRTILRSTTGKFTRYKTANMNNTWWVKQDQLDQRQRAVIDLPLSASHLILGPPGSGKTNLLLLRASQMVLSGKPNILVVVFTRTLREFLVTGSSRYEFPADNIVTLSGWSSQFLALRRLLWVNEGSV